MGHAAVKPERDECLHPSLVLHAHQCWGVAFTVTGYLAMAVLEVPPNYPHAARHESARRPPNISETQKE